MDELFKQILKETPDHTKRFVDLAMDVSDQIIALLEAKGHNQKYLADKLGKSESEISKWLSGNHNFTLRTLAKIESILEENIVVAPMYWHEYKGLEKGTTMLKGSPNTTKGSISMPAQSHYSLTTNSVGEYQVGQVA